MNDFNFPKIDLHLHLDGSFRFETIWELCQKEGVKLPADTLEAYKAFIHESANCGEVNKYLRMFDDPQKVMQDKESLSRITYELIEDLHNLGLRYAEIRFAPQFHTAKGLSQDDACEAVLLGRNKALDKYKDIYVNIIVCMMSLGPTSINEDENFKTIEVAKKYRNQGITGIDLAGAEGLVPLSDFGKFFKKAKEENLNMTCHAGDSQGPDTVKDAIDFGVSRIGHGHHIYDDKNLCEVAINKNITLEICPTSNIQCNTQPSYKLHPAKKLFDMGVPVTINTDNMTLAGVNLDSEYKHCIDEMGFSKKDLIKANIYSAKCAFMDENLRKEILNELDIALKEED